MNVFAQRAKLIRISVKLKKSIFAISLFATHRLHGTKNI